MRSQTSAGPPVRLEIPTPWPIGPVNVWLLRGRPLTLIDAGPDTREAADALRAGLRRHGHEICDIELLVITHQHTDHLGLGAMISRESRCVVAAHECLATYAADLEESVRLDAAYDSQFLRMHGVGSDVIAGWQREFNMRRGELQSFEVSLALRSGQRFTAGDRSLTAALRPGHSPTDTVFVDRDDRTAFVGDHTLATTFPIARPHRPLCDWPLRPEAIGHIMRGYLASLERTDADSLRCLYPGHGQPLYLPAQLAAKRREFHRERCETVLMSVRARPRTAAELVHTLFPRLTPPRIFLGVSEVLAALDLLEARGLVETLDADPICYGPTRG